MKLKKSHLNKLALFGIAVALISSCSKDDDAAAPVSSFSYEIDDKTVTFTNTSENATIYEWSFGDDSDASTSENPVYTYDAYGDYDVRLTATGDGGSVTEKVTISVVKEWPTITIDGDFTDWDDIDLFYGGYDTLSGALYEAKITSDASSSKLYIYIKGDIAKATNPTLQMFINPDADTTTGWSYDIGLEGNGIEYLVEFYMHEETDQAGIFPIDADLLDGSWNWDANLIDAGSSAITELNLVDDSEIEFVIETSLFKLPALGTSIGVCFWTQPTDWSAASGTLPPLNQDPELTQNTFSFQ